MALAKSREEVVRYRRFGPEGPVYEILGISRRLSDGDVMLRVRLVETGEELDYRQSRALNDPIEG